MEHESLDSDALGECPVLMLVPMLRVTNDGMSEVSHVQTDLMVPPRMRGALHEAKPGCVITRHCIGQFAAGQGGEFCLRRFRRSIHALGEGLGNATLMKHMTTYQGQILLLGLSGFKLGLARVDGRSILAKNDHTAGRFVQTVNRVQTSRMVIPKDVPQIFIFVSVNGCFVYQ